MYLKKHQGTGRPVTAIFALLVVATTLFIGCPSAICDSALTSNELERLEAGEVILDACVAGSKLPLVQGKILIKSRPDKVWSIVINPREFVGKIQKHVRKFRFLKDTPRTSVLDCQVEVAAFLPRFNYVVESDYEPCKRIDFRRVGGALKDFRGYWLFESRDDGAHTLVTYAMYLDPGFFVPQWIIRQGLKRELPETLDGIRARVTELDLETTHSLAHRAG